MEETIRWTMDFPSGASCEAVTSYNHSADKFRADAKRSWLAFKEHAFTYRGIVGETSRGPLTYPAINQQAAHMDDLADSILKGRKILVPGEIGRRDLQIINLHLRSPPHRQTCTDPTLITLPTSTTTPGY